MEQNQQNQQYQNMINQLNKDLVETKNSAFDQLKVANDNLKRVENAAAGFSGLLQAISQRIGITDEAPSGDLIMQTLEEILAPQKKAPANRRVPAKKRTAAKKTK